MKKGIIAMLFILGSTSIFGSVYIKYYNKDSKDYKFKVTMDGSTKEVEFRSSTSGATTVQGSGTKCIIETPCGKFEVKADDKIEIKDGCIKVVN
ncbi:MAG: hypothetical protein IPJ31_01420 [Bacteroidetes bacterium]|nr:hypothetical protein [Bacteroidota bacterium]MBP6315196.1 hypothetical protein [Chitinophagaceae bacterium]